MAVVDAVRKRAPHLVPSAQLALAGCVALYMAGSPPWAVHLSHPVDRKAIEAQLADIDGRTQRMPSVPDHFKCGEPRGPEPVHTHLEDWHGDCSFSSGMVFAMPRSPCLSFTFRPAGAAWTAADEQSLKAMRVNADSDPMVACGLPTPEGDSRRLTMCESKPPRFLLDGMRLYAIASLDDKLVPLDRLKLMRIDSTPACSP